MAILDVMKLFLKDPAARLDYTMEWDDYLDPLGDTISASEWRIIDPGVTIDTPTNTPKTATIWVSSGTIGQTYKVTNKITTAAGRIDERTLAVRIVER